MSPSTLEFAARVYPGCFSQQSTKALVLGRYGELARAFSAAGDAPPHDPGQRLANLLPSPECYFASLAAQTTTTRVTRDRATERARVTGRGAAFAYGGRQSRPSDPLPEPARRRPRAGAPGVLER